MRIRKPLSLALVVALNITPGAHAAAPPAAQIEINHLLGLIQQSGCEFYRNGTWYDAQHAQAHLRAKYEMLAADGQIKTAEDFIEKAASTSSMSGQPYQMRCGAGAAMTTNQWFLAALMRLRSRISRNIPCAPRTAHRTQGLFASESHQIVNRPI
ncbi:MAG: DUF5329 domain-containing protein [Steroidobacteraceae bacterium]